MSSNNLNFTLNGTFVNIDVSSPDQKYEDVWFVYFSIPILPFSLILAWTLAGLYVVGMVLFQRLTKGNKSGTERFAASPWWALAWSRIILAVVGVLFFLGCRFARVPVAPLGPFSIPAFTFLLDLGAYFIVIGHIRAFFIVYGIHRSFRYVFLRRVWGFLVFVMMLGGLYLGPFKIKPEVKLELGNDLPEWVDTLANTGYAVYGISRTVLLVSMVGMLPFMVRTALFAGRRKKMGEKFDHARWVTALTFLVSFALLLPIVIPSVLRVWASLRVSLAVYVVTSVVPELFIFGLWVALGRFVTRQDKLLAEKEQAVRDCLRRVWLGYLTAEHLEVLPAPLREFVMKFDGGVKPEVKGVKGMHGVLNMLWYYASALPSQRQFAGMNRPPRLLKELEGLFEGLRVPAVSEAERIGLMKEQYEKSRTVGWLKDAMLNLQDGMGQRLIKAELGVELFVSDEDRYYEKGIDPESGFTAGEMRRNYVRLKRAAAGFTEEEEAEGFEQYDLVKFGEVQLILQGLFETLGKSIVLVERRQDSIFRKTVPWQIDAAATRVEFVRNLLDATAVKQVSVKDAGDCADIWLELLLWERGVL
ncbi:hypothetical protein QBC44DRAFT_368736 [Cladorrhinum sp. PSN332]|nr:hypothetical protein QBC44DRAFT_368736 [Cladorrhinum sp. PSN332]